MISQVSVDDLLLKKALKIEGKLTKKELVTRALEEYIARRKRWKELEASGILIVNEAEETLMKKWIPIFSLFALIFFPFEGMAIGEDSLKEKFQSLGEASQTAERECNSYLEELNAIPGILKGNEGTTFQNRAVAIRVLRKLSKNPGVSRETKKAAHFIIDHPEILESEWFTEVGKRLIPYCGLMQSYEYLRVLIDDGKKYRLKSVDQALVKRATLKLIETESSYPTTLVSVGAQLSLLQKLYKAGMLDETESFEKRLAELQQEYHSLKDRVRNRIVGNEHAKLFTYEFVETNELRKKIWDLYLQIR